MNGYSEVEIREAGIAALNKDRGELIDNCYRARLIPSWFNVQETTKELKKKWSDYMAECQRNAK